MSELHCWWEPQEVLFVLNQCFIAFLCDHIHWKGPLQVQSHSEQNQLQISHWSVNSVNNKISFVGFYLLYLAQANWNCTACRQLKAESRRQGYWLGVWGLLLCSFETSHQEGKLCCQINSCSALHLHPGAMRFTLWNWCNLNYFLKIRSRRNTCCFQNKYCSAFYNNYWQDFPWRNGRLRAKCLG